MQKLVLMIVANAIISGAVLLLARTMDQYDISWVARIKKIGAGKVVSRG